MNDELPNTPARSGVRVRELLPVQKAPLHIAKLAKAPLGQLDMLPAVSGVYVALDDAGRVWYVGLAGSSLRERLKTHDRLSDFRSSNVTTIAWKEVEEEKCGALETAAIKFFGPPLNLQNNDAFPCTATGLSPDEEVERYLRLKLQAKWIVLELQALRPNVVSHCQKAGGEIIHRLGKLDVRLVPLWQFSSAVEELQQKVKALRDQEQVDGTAVRTERLAPWAYLDRMAISSQIAIHLTPLLDDEIDGDEMAEAEEV